MFRNLFMAPVLLGLFSSLPLYAPPTGPYKIPGSFSFAPILEQTLFPDVKEFYKEQLARGLWLVSQLAPAHQQPFRFPWEGVPNTKMEYYVTSNGDPWVMERKLVPMPISGVTVWGVDGVMHIRQYYLFDRLYFHANQTAKKGAFVELAMTLAYEIFGVIPYYIDGGYQALYNIPDRQTVRNIKIGATIKTIEFLEKLQRGEEAGALSEDDRARIPELIAANRNDLLLLQCGNQN
jgi:hypothetical protein